MFVQMWRLEIVYDSVYIKKRPPLSLPEAPLNLVLKDGEWWGEEKTHEN